MDTRSWSADLERVVEAEVGEGRFLLGGHSMGAHTAVAYALRHPERLAGLALIGPVYTGEIKPSSLDYWDGLAAALEADGVDGFVAYIDERAGDRPALARLGAALHPRAAAAARAPRGAGAGAARGAALAAVRLAGRSWARSRSRPWSSPATTTPTPAIPTRPPPPTPRRCRTRGCSARARGSRRSPGRAASSPAP